MHANRNKNVIKRLGKGMMKVNRTRNRIAVLAVALTTFMIATVFSLGINYMENTKLMSERTAGTSADVSLSTPTAEQERQIRALEYVETVGVQYMVGSVADKNDQGRELSIILWYYDATEWEDHYESAVSEINGQYPSRDNEIMMSLDALSQLGITEPTLNMEIPLSYNDRNGRQQSVFLLSGWFRSYTGTGMAFVSEAYCKNAGYTLQQDGVLSLSLSSMPDDYFRIQDDVKLDENQVFQAAVSMGASGVSVIATVLLLVLFIIGCGYLLIYNVLYISISQDTRFYGLIKTLGTTQQQIKLLVKRQAFLFACIGIPVGIVCAAAVSWGIVPLVMRQGFEQGKSSMDAVVFFRPSIFVLSVLFSAATVWIACNAPARAAAKVSPVEALRYQNFVPKKSKKRNSKNGAKLCHMAFRNVFRDKKRALLVFVSLFMGITTILGVNGVLGSINGENYINKYLEYDFQYIDLQFTQSEQQQEVSRFDESFVEQISQIDGIENITVQKSVWSEIEFDESALDHFIRIKYEDSACFAAGKSYEQMVSQLKSYAEAGDYGCYVATLDENVIREYNKTHTTTIDLDAFCQGKLAVVGFDSEHCAPNAALVGKTLTLKPDSEDGTPAQLLIGGAFSFDDYRTSAELGQRKFIEAVPDVIYVSEAGMKNLTPSPVIYNIGIDVGDLSQLQKMESKLQEINSTLPASEWQYISSVGTLEQFNQMYYSLNVLGNGASILLIVIGLINFINVMLTGVMARRNEFAIMESVGTTKIQIRKMLILEGGIYALFSVMLILTFGNAFLALVAKAVPNIANYAVFQYPMLLVLCLIITIFVICLTVPVLVYRVISKETVIERLHNFDN